ncbi:hypothetical protein [Streptodolium elevatio]|uniref:Uncharacterized protein n=1 Tax=Streptodolium elevatio TaxID=3157996 RepID=A0ABV3DKG2_9ACTN
MVQPDHRRDIRDAPADGATLLDAPYLTAQLSFFRAVQATSDAMRADLGIPELGFEAIGFDAGSRPPGPV